MKAMCIKDGRWEGNGNSFGPQYGEIVTILYIFEQDYYILEEYYQNPHDGIRECYLKQWFIPLSDIDETELVNEKLQTA